MEKHNRCHGCGQFFFQL